MSLRVVVLLFVAIALVFSATTNQRAQEGSPSSSTSAKPEPTPTPRYDQDPIRVFTEEVRLPLVAHDEYGRFDPTLEPGDLIVFEDGVQQEIKSLQRIPASVLLLLDTGGEMNPAMRVSTTRDAAQRLISNLRDGDEMSILQFSGRVEVLQAWTEDKSQAAHVLKTKLHSGSGSRFAQAIKAAAFYFVNQPLGNRHLVLISDGVELGVGKANYTEAMKALAANSDAEYKSEWDAAVKRLLEAQVSVHIISYTEYGRLALKGKVKKYKGSNAPAGSVLSSGIQNSGLDPTMPPGTHRGFTTDPAFGVGINFDPQMRRLRKAYEKALKSSEQRLSSLAEETGARILKPGSAPEMADRAAEVARDIGSQYVITYVPKRPLAEAKPGEYRKVQVATRRSGLTVRSRRGYIVTP